MNRCINRKIHLNVVIKNYNDIDIKHLYIIQLYYEYANSLCVLEMEVTHQTMNGYLMNILNVGPD